MRGKRGKPGLPGFLPFWAAVLLAFILLSLSVNKKEESVLHATTTLPEVAVISQRIPAAISSTSEIAVPQDNSVIPAPIGDAQAEPTAPPASALPQKSDGTIMLKDKTGGIVGQMARIPVENDQITEVKATNEVDNSNGHELLSIVGKY